MPFILIFLGLLLTVVGVRDKQDDFVTLIKGDFTGSKNFLDWFIAILVIGSIGYIPGLKKVSDGLLILVILVLFLSNKGFFANFSQTVTGK